jgi:N utilization substance protein A
MDEKFIGAIEQICIEKGLEEDKMYEVVEQAIASAWQKDYAIDDLQPVRVEIDRDSKKISIFVEKTIVEGKVSDDASYISLSEVLKKNTKAKAGDTMEVEVHPESFGRIAAQAAKHVILSRIRDLEKEMIIEEYSEKVDTIINGIVQRIEYGNVYFDLGRGIGVMPYREQVKNEKYYPGQRLKVYIAKVEEDLRGPRVIVSRAAAGLIRELFNLEVPEVEGGTVEIVSVVREAGVRTKMSVKATMEGIDPVGTFVGGRGTRVQAVRSEIGSEKIDIIVYSDDIKEYITNSLSPTQITSIDLDEDNQSAKVNVTEDQFSLAIGSGGQNVRLASRLTGWNLDIAQVEGIANATVVKNKKKIDSEDSLLSAVDGE